MSSNRPEVDRGPVLSPEPSNGHTADGMGKTGSSALKQRLLHHLLAALPSRRDRRLSEDDLRVELSRMAEEVVDSAGHSLGYAEQQTVVAEVLSEVFGYGPIDVLLRDHAITDIFINGPRQVYFEKSGQVLPADLAFRDEEHLLQVVDRMLTGSGHQLGEGTRMVDARMPDGSRVNVVLNVPALNGPLVTIRRFGTRPLAADDLLANESLTPEMLDFLAACVRGRINMVVSGGSGAGKTTLLNALSRFIPEAERVVTVEDTAELQLQQRHVAKMEAKAANPDGQSEISMRDLVRNSLRMRPDRVVVGECRGAEVLDMLQAMNTGHEGSMTTVHANDPREALARIELMAVLAGTDIPLSAVRRLVASSVNLIVQVARLAGGRRKVVAVSEITGMEGEVVSMHALFEFVQTGVDAGQAAAGYFRATGIRPRCLDKLRVRGADLAPQIFAERVLHAQKNRGPQR
jgi:pilus assembly protein CpaF